MQKRFWAFCIATIAFSAHAHAVYWPGLAVSSSLQVPGVSAALYAAPYYTCSTIKYISTSGNDTTGTGSSGAPWATLAKFNSTTPTAGECAYVAPGTYSAGVEASSGGSTASASGYVVYRCQTLDGCIITDPGNQSCGGSSPVHAAIAVCADYLIFDGFSIINTSESDETEAIGAASAGNAFTFTFHHAWLINSVISGFGESGVQLNEGEYFYIIHNTIYQNAQAASCDSSYQGSGISLASEIATPSYTPTADDGNNSVTGNTGSLFRNFIMWNVIYNNYVSPCAATTLSAAITSTGQTSISVTSGSSFGNTNEIRIDNEYMEITAGGGTNTWTVTRGYGGTSAATHLNGAPVSLVESTDGNGIILDTWSWSCGAGGSGCQTGASAYTNGGLVAFNVIYNNGGAGIHDQNSEYVTIANNDCYNSYLDLNNNGTARSCINTLFSYADTVINNIAYAIGGSSVPTSINSAMGPDGPGTTQTTTLNGNITSGQTSLTLASAAEMPTGASGYAGNGSYALPGGNEIQIGSEKMLVTAGWGTTSLTVTRGYESTTAASHTSGATVTWVPDYFANNVTYATGGSATDLDGNCNPGCSGNNYSSAINLLATNPSWSNVGNNSTGSESTQPVGTNFALQSGSPAINYGSVSSPFNFLNSQAVDAGACSHTAGTCP